MTLKSENELNHLVRTGLIVGSRERRTNPPRAVD